MKLKPLIKLQFTKDKNQIDSHSEPFASDKDILELKHIKIEQIEIQSTEGISHITIEIYDDNSHKLEIPLYNKWNKFFIHQNFYIWDTSQMDEFTLTTERLMFRIKFVSDKDFKATIYCTTNRQYESVMSRIL